MIITFRRIQNCMRRRADWWVLADDMILEYISDEGTGTPKVISKEIDRSQGYVNQRCSLLESYGLLTKVARGVYTLSEAGKQYLSEDLDASTLEKSE